MADPRILAARLYGFIDTAYLQGRDPAILTRELIEGGVDIIQVRAKQVGREELLRLARAVIEESSRFNVPLIINDDISVAQELNADGVHLGQEDWAALSPAQRGELRTQLRNIGISTHSLAQAVAAEEDGATYIAIGPVFKTATKPNVAPIGVGLVREVISCVKNPVFTIGGINLRNLNSVLGAGATRIAVVSAILNAPNVTKAAADFKKRL